MTAMDYAFATFCMGLPFWTAGVIVIIARKRLNRKVLFFSSATAIGSFVFFGVGWVLSNWLPTRISEEPTKRYTAIFL